MPTKVLENQAPVKKLMTLFPNFQGEEFLNSFIDFLGTHHTHIYTQMTE